MTATADLNPRIVEALYGEALVLADKVHERFAEERRAQDEAVLTPAAAAVLAAEALQATTRVMHCLAWLLNHRAYFAGEISELQLRRHGRLVTSRPASGEAAARLPGEVRALIAESERLYARVVRLELAWRGPPLPEAAPSAVDRLRQRLATMPA